ncbi:MAG: hypothetical protein ACLGXA_08810 [Acidobacteriota bacterium]
MPSALPVFCFAILCTGSAQILGCGSSAQSMPMPGQGVSITTQPSNQSVPLGQVATFTVIASGTAPLSYQWAQNGSIISGATGAAYTTPVVTASDSGSKFVVTISDSVNSITSNAVTLTVGPRSPKTGDLRFQEVGSVSEEEQSLQGSTSSIFNTQGQWCDGCVGSPLTIGDSADCSPQPAASQRCIWGFFTTPLPPGQSGLNTYYLGGQYANFGSDLTSSPVTNMPPAQASNSVVTSLDFQPTFNAYAMAWIQTVQQDGAFDMRREIVPASAVASTVAADATASRVVTAVSFDANDQANLLSYGWQGDTTTVYDTAVMTVAAEAGIESAVQTLAGEGYIVTAFGGDPVNGFLIVGTKVHGDTLARPIDIVDQSTPACYHCTVGFAPVIWYQAPAQYHTVVYEK